MFHSQGKSNSSDLYKHFQTGTCANIYTKLNKSINFKLKCKILSKNYKERDRLYGYGKRRYFEIVAVLISKLNLKKISLK